MYTMGLTIHLLIEEYYKIIIIIISERIIHGII